MKLEAQHNKLSITDLTVNTQSLLCFCYPQEEISQFYPSKNCTTAHEKKFFLGAHAKSKEWSSSDNVAGVSGRKRWSHHPSVARSLSLPEASGLRLLLAARTNIWKKKKKDISGFAELISMNFSDHSWWLWSVEHCYSFKWSNLWCRKLHLTYCIY